MLNFRYHALSLVAVFLALAIGVVLGVAIGDKGIVSGARKELEKSLRGDLSKARDRNADLASQLGVRDGYEGKTYPALVTGLLRGNQVGLVAIGNLPNNYGSEVRDALRPTGARLASVSVVASPLGLGGIAKDLGRQLFPHLQRSKRQLERFGRRIGHQLATGGPLPRRVRGSLFSSSQGSFRRLDAVVLARDRNGLDGKQKAAEDAFEKGLIAGLKAAPVTLVGVEQQNTDPSQVGFFKDNEISTVDDLDLTAGHAALVYVLGGRHGNFGTGAGDLLPARPRHP